MSEPKQPFPGITQEQICERAQEIGDQDFSGETTFREWLGGLFMAALISKRDIPRAKDFAPIATELHHNVTNTLMFLAFDQLKDELQDEQQEQEDT